MAGSVKININMERLLMQMRRELTTAMRKACILLQGHIKKKVGVGGGKPHIPSRPGEPPRRDTGALAASIAYEIETKGNQIVGKVGSDIDKLKQRAQRVGTTVDYALYLEVGTDKMARRPWLEPSVKECKERINRLLKKAYAKGIEYINRAK